MSTEIITDADQRMARAVEAMERDFQAVRTGRPLVRSSLSSLRLHEEKTAAVSQPL